MSNGEGIEMARSKPFVWLHSDIGIPDCSCGDRDWEVQTPHGFMWSDRWGPGSFSTLGAAMDYASSLHEGHPDVVPVSSKWGGR